MLIAPFSVWGSRVGIPAELPSLLVGARFAFFVSLAHVKDRLKQGDGVFERGLENRICQIWCEDTYNDLERTVGLSRCQAWKSLPTSRLIET